MVEALALRIAQAIKRADHEKTASLEVLKFSLEGLLNTIFTILLLSIIGLLSGKFGSTMMAFGAFAFLRFFSGGLHLRKALHCSLLSSLLIAAAPHVAMNEDWIIGLGTLSLISVLIFAPSNIEGHARIPSKYFIYLKLISAAIVCTNFIFMNPVVCAVFAVQAIFIIQVRR